MYCFIPESKVPINRNSFIMFKFYYIDFWTGFSFFFIFNKNVQITFFLKFEWLVCVMTGILIHFFTFLLTFFQQIRRLSMRRSCLRLSRLEFLQVRLSTQQSIRMISNRKILNIPLFDPKFCQKDQNYLFIPPEFACWDPATDYSMGPRTG